METNAAAEWLSAEVQGDVERLGELYEIEFLEEAARQRPMQFETLVRLGQLYSRVGRVREGLCVDLRLRMLAPDDPIVRYNLACSFALLGHRSAALDELRAAVSRGYRDVTHLAEDADLASLWPTAPFQEILAGLRTR